jgi:hypothetical protein
MPTLVEELRALFGGRRLLLTGAPLAALTGPARRLRALGAERPFLLATGIGTAPLAVAAFALADRRFGTAIGPLEPARPVR